MKEEYPTLNPPSNEINGRVPTESELRKQLEEKQPAKDIVPWTVFSSHGVEELKDLEPTHAFAGPCPACGNMTVEYNAQNGHARCTHETVYVIDGRMQDTIDHERRVGSAFRNPNGEDFNPFQRSNFERRIFPCGWHGKIKQEVVNA